jgi:hypothetical protein
VKVKNSLWWKNKKALEEPKPAKERKARKKRGPCERTVVDTRCTNCEKTLPASDFCTNTASKTGINNICKACAKETNSQYGPYLYPPKPVKERKARENHGPYERTVIDTRRTKCEKTLPASDFSTSTASKTGIGTRCKACRNVEWQTYSRKKYGEKAPKQVGPYERTLEYTRCRTCEKTLPPSEFTTCVALKSGILGHCKTCHNKRHRESNQPK